MLAAFAGGNCCSKWACDKTKLGQQNKNVDRALALVHGKTNDLPGNGVGARRAADGAQVLSSNVLERVACARQGAGTHQLMRQLVDPPGHRRA